jgi:hypothetical protein
MKSQTEVALARLLALVCFELRWHSRCGRSRRLPGLPS